jgi:uncharacterized protein
VSLVYLDASAFVKLLVQEPESHSLRTFLARAPKERASSALLRTEAVRAVRHLGPKAVAGARSALRRIDLVSLDDRVLDQASILEPKILRTLDAIHLATALALGDDLRTLVTYDERMIEGASLLGLPSDSPR